MSKLTKSANGMDCIRCDAPDAYACHFNGTYQYWYGKGRGIKASDLATAEFCYKCDQDFSEGVNIYHNQEERDAQFLHFIIVPWAENMRKTHDQIKCEGCGLYLCWRPKNTHEK